MKLIEIIRCLLVTVLAATAVSASAQIDPIVGTWRKSNNSAIEIKPDGAVYADGQAVGSWMKKTTGGAVQDRQYYLRWNGDVRLYSARLESHDRRLTATTAKGASGSVERIYNGPTVNPDVPDEQSARKLDAADELAGLQMEMARLEAQIESLSAQRDALLRGAAAEREAHQLARLTGRISAHLAVATKKEMDAANLAGGIAAARARLTMVRARLAAIH